MVTASYFTFNFDINISATLQGSMNVTAATSGYLSTFYYPSSDANCSGTTYDSVSITYYSNTCMSDGKGGSFKESIDPGFIATYLF